MNPQQIPVYVVPEMSVNVMNENEIYSSSSGWTFSHEASNTKIEKMTLKLTTHKLLLFHPTNRQVFNFEFKYENIKSYEVDKRGWFAAFPYKLHFDMLDGSAYKVKKMDRTDVTPFTRAFERSYKSGDWKKKHVVGATHMHETFKLRNKIRKDKQEVRSHQDKVGSSFYNFDAFLKNLESLDEVFDAVRQGLKNDTNFNSSHKTSEADQILEELGAVEIVSKSESGRNFYRQVAKQITAIFSKVLPKKGGVMSLIDVYLYYNRMRGSDLVTSNDLLLATKELRAINSTLELRELRNGLKIIQLRTLDKAKDFRDIQDMIYKNKDGLTIDEYCKSTDLSPIIGRYKLNGYLEEGKLCLDSSLSGLRYYINDLITVEFK